MDIITRLGSYPNMTFYIWLGKQLFMDKKIYSRLLYYIVTKSDISILFKILPKLYNKLVIKIQPSDIFTVFYIKPTKYSVVFTRANGSCTNLDWKMFAKVANVKIKNGVIDLILAEEFQENPTVGCFKQETNGLFANFHCNDGKVAYIGGYRDRYFNGPGSLYVKDEYVLTSDWIESQPSGETRMYMYENEKIFVGNMLPNYRWDGGVKSVGKECVEFLNYLDGNLDGIQTYLYRNGERVYKLMVDGDLKKENSYIF